MSKEKTQSEVKEKSTVKGIKPAETTVKHRDKRGIEPFHIELSRIRIDDSNRRTDESYGDIEEFSKLIEAVGQINPAKGHRNADGTWTLTAGHRRYAALMLIAERTKQEQTIFISRTEDKSMITRLKVQYAENVYQPTNDYDKALIIGGLIKEGLKPKDIVKQLGIPQPTVSRLMALLQTPEEVQNAMRNKEVSPVTVSKMIRGLQSKGAELTEEVNSSIAKAKAEGKTKATDRHSTAAGTRTPQTIMKDLVKRFEAKATEEKPLTNAEAFALEFCKKILTKPSDQALAAFLRNYDN